MSDKSGTPTDHWPLNESQRSAIACRLAGIERDLQRLTTLLEHPPPKSRMIHYVDVPALPGGEINRLVTPIQRSIQQLADNLHLAPQEESVRRSFTASLLLNEVGLEEVEPSRLRGYGAVNAATADYLNRELPGLRALVRELRESLSSTGKAR